MKTSIRMFNKIPIWNTIIQFIQNSKKRSNTTSGSGTNPNKPSWEIATSSTSKGKELEDLKNEIIMSNAGLYCLVTKLLKNEK